MPADDAVLRSARNAFLVVLVLLLAISIYQFVTLGTVSTAVLLLWAAGAGVFYASKVYYRRQDETLATESESIETESDEVELEETESDGSTER